MIYWRRERRLPFTAGKEPIKKARLIGVVGAGRGVGVTHFCILLAEYLAIDRGSQVAVCECNMHGDLKWMEPQIWGDKRKESIGEVEKNDECRFFSFRQVHYFSSVDWASLKRICEDYHYLILDMGTQLTGKERELALCQKKILLGSKAWWKLDTSQKKEAYFLKAGFQCIYNLSEKGLPFCPLDTSPVKKVRDIFEGILNF